MKNQYFGDNKDLFKYDLIFRVMQAGLVERFTFIPMLTEPDDTRHGRETDRRRAKVGTENQDLVSFLDECVKTGRRDIEQLTDFFARYDIEMTIYCGKGGYFSHQRRQEYFEQIGSELLSGSLVFVDPDIGLEVARSREKHILYLEVNNLYQRMDKSSILMLYQHFPREEHHEYLHRRSEELREIITGEWPICIYDDEIIFFFLTKNESLERSLTHVVQEYAESYSK